MIQKECSSISLICHGDFCWQLYECNCNAAAVTIDAALIHWNIETCTLEFLEAIMKDEGLSLHSEISTLSQSQRKAVLQSRVI
jgi:hypothetical protein